MDRIYAEKLANDLKSWGVDVWWDKAELKVGDSLTAKIQDGLSSASWLAVVLTPDSIHSAWVQRELNSALIRELEELHVVVLPLLFRDCQVPLFLKDKLYADFRMSYEEGLRMLLARLCPPIKPNIIAALMSEDKPRILNAYTRIPRADQSKYMDYLTRCLANTSVGGRMAPMFALWALNSDRLPSALLAGVADLSQSVRRQAVFLMGESHDAFYSRIISGLMSDGNPAVRQAARDAFKKIDHGVGRGG